MSGSGPLFLMLIVFALVGVLLFFPLRWIAMRSVRQEDVPPEEFDPRRTPLSGVEIFALVLPPASFLLGGILGYVVYSRVWSADVGFPDWFQWVLFVLIFVFAFAAHRIGDSLSRRLLRNAKSRLGMYDESE